MTTTAEPTHRHISGDFLRPLDAVEAMSADELWDEWLRIDRIRTEAQHELDMLTRFMAAKAGVPFRE
jgi:hypothetical protein